MIWHQNRPPQPGGAYELFVAPLGFPYGGLPKIVDLDIDSDNNNGLEQSPEEDSIEDSPSLPGKLVMVNYGDADGDGIPRYADWDESSAIEPNHFVPMLLQIPTTVDITRCKLKLEFNNSPLVGVTHQGTPPVWRPAPGNLRIWRRDADQSRNPASARIGLNPGDYVEPGIYADIGKLGFSEGTREVPFRPKIRATCNSTVSARQFGRY